MTDAPQSEAVAKLKAECDKAYDGNKDSCSHAVMAVVHALVDQKMPYRQANSLIDYMSQNWTEVSLEDGYYLANLGRVVVGGKKATGNGHVIVIYPGDKKSNGGYQFFYKKDKKYLTLKSTGAYARCMSTSISKKWPGAMSKGDKTVWDPWGKDEAFEDVLFWAEANIWESIKRPG
jgi:hypothetical protein